MIKLPAGAVPLATDDVIHALAVKDHPEADQGNPFLDLALTRAIQTGQVVACRLVDGRLGFTRTGR